MRFISPLERCLPGPGNLTAIGVTHVARQAFRHILMQSLVSRQFRWFEPFGKVLCFPGRWATADAASNLMYPNVLGREQPDLFTRGE
jgi:hypothetical protein